LGKLGSGLFLKPLWASCGLKFGRERLRVLGDEVNQQLLDELESLFARTLFGTNRTNFIVQVTPRRKRSLADAIAPGNIGESPTGDNRGHGFCSEVGRMCDATGHPSANPAQVYALGSSLCRVATTVGAGYDTCSLGSTSGVAQKVVGSAQMTNGSAKYILVDVSPEELHTAPHQPPVRTEMNMALNALKRSIGDIGLQYPPLVIRNPSGDGFTIADGHRRIAAMRELQYEKIPVLISSGRAEQLFSEVSGTVKAITANQWIYVYLHGGHVPSGQTRVNIGRLDETMGKDFLRRIYDAGMSPQIWSVANRFLKYTKIEDEQKRPVLEWLLAHRLTQQVSAWITGGNRVEELRLAFQQDRAPTA